MSETPRSLAERMEALRRRLEGTRARWLGADLGGGLAAVLAASAAGLLLVTIAGAAGLSPLLHSILLWLVLFTAVAVSAWVLARSLRRRPSIPALALRAGGEDSRVGSRILGGLELWGRRSRTREGYSLPLIDAVAGETCRLAAGTDLERLVPWRKLRRSLRYLAGAAAAWVLLVLVLPGSARQSWERLPVLFAGEVVPGIRVEPGDCELPPGGSLRVRAFVDAPGVKEASFLYRSDGGTWASAAMAPAVTGSPDASGPSAFAYEFPQVERPLLYAVSSGEALSDTFHVGIRARPRIVGIRVDYDYPGYTGLPDRKGADGDGRITALKGTVATVNVLAGRPLGGVVFVVGDRDTVHGEVLEDSTRARGRIPVLGSGSYQVRVFDREGFGADPADSYPIVALDDESPLVELTSPEPQALLPPDLRVTLRGRAFDDFGFSRVLLHFFRADEDEEETVEISGPVRVKEYAVEYAWDLNDLGLLPGQVVSYFVEVWDNDDVSGPKRAATEIRALRFPSVTEIFAQADARQEEKIEDLEDVYRDEESLKERLDEVSRDMKREEPSWEAQKEIKDIAGKQQEIHERLDDIASGLDETKDMLADNELMNTEILEKMAQLRDLVAQVATPEMREAMQRLQEAIDRLSREEIEKALKDFDMSQEEFLERLERSIELLERLRIEQRMEQMAEAAEALAQEQTDLAQDTQGAPPDSLGKLGGREEGVRRAAEDLARQISDTAQMAEKLEPEAADALKDIARQLAENEVLQRLEAARNALSAAQSSESQAATGESARNLQRLAQDLRLAQNSLSMQRRQQLAEAMEKLVRELIWFSFEEEKIADEVPDLRTRDLDARREAADQQVSLGSCASRLTQRLRDLSRQTFLVSPDAAQSLDEAVNHMREAARILESGNTSPADEEGLVAMALINRAAMALLESKQCMSSCSSPMGLSEMLKRMESMSAQQAAINRATQKMMSETGERGLSTEARAQMARLAAEQEAVRKSAEDLAQEMGEDPQILGRMEGLVSEMEKVVEDLRSMGLKPETVERQQKILSRLLDAQKSVRRRDYMQARLSRTGEAVSSESPAPLAGETEWVPSEIRQDLLKAAGGAYPPKYESLIRSYFRSLAREGVEEPSTPDKP